MEKQLLIRESVSDYKHFDLGNIKLAFTQVCQEEIFRDVYFGANSLYYVESGSAELYCEGNRVNVEKGEICLIKQHSKLDIKKNKDKDGKDFKSIIFYLFPDFVADFVKQAKEKKSQSDLQNADIIHLGKHVLLKDFCESLLPLFENKQLSNADIKQKTFVALNHLSQHNKELLSFLFANSKPIKIDLYEFMIHIGLYNYSVTELAQLTGRSLSAFKRDFQTIFETTPHQWLLSHKIDYAEQLLKDKKMKASDIYVMLGFNELSHFSSAFKKVKGISPTRL
jgi:AraC-like DNA-binding protein